MLFDDLLDDGQAMRRLVNLLLRRSRPATDARIHESFIDQAALQEELAARLGRRARGGLD